MPRRRLVWIVGFLAGTVGVLTAECWAAWDGDPDTVPWTELIVGYVPDEVTMLVLCGLFGWLLLHFGKRYYLRRRGKTR